MKGLQICYGVVAMEFSRTGEFLTPTGPSVSCFADWVIEQKESIAGVYRWYLSGLLFQVRTSTWEAGDC